MGYTSGIRPARQSPATPSPAIIGIYINNGGGTYQGNIIAGNSSYGIYYSGTTLINAENNYWGDPTGPYDPSDDIAAGGLYNPNGLGDSVSDHVDYEPWITDLGDSDNDGIPDGWEINAFGNLTSADDKTDYDQDGLLDIDEYADGTDPKDPDSDGDGMLDGWEVNNNLSPLDDDALLDSDNDGFCNLREFLSQSDPWDDQDIPQMMADFDFDDDADGIDMTTLIVEFGRNDCSPADPCECDLDGDGDVDDVDLILFSEDYGRIEISR